MSALIKCKACDRDVSPKAASCPHCGEPVAPPKEKQTATGLLAAIIIGLFVGFLIFKVLGLI
jgi:hypothetical protein